MASEITLTGAQNYWAHPLEEVSGNVSSPVATAASSLSQLAINARPHPELFHLYFRDNHGSQYRLVKDPDTLTTKIVHLYAQHQSLSYATASPPSTNIPKETLTTPRNSTYQKSRAQPTRGSTSYPQGVRTYYMEINGKMIRFDQGHGVPQADTLEHEGQRSAQDPENYVPQNIKYNIL